MLVYFKVIWYFFPFWYVVPEKNLATLVAKRSCVWFLKKQTEVLDKLVVCEENFFLGFALFGTESTNVFSFEFSSSDFENRLYVDPRYLEIVRRK
jgi:hypothetical protein